MTTEHIFKLAPGDVIMMGGWTYTHTHDGYVKGPVDPELARRDQIHPNHRVNRHPVDGLHCVYGTCRGVPNSPHPCNPGCYYRSSTT